MTHTPGPWTLTDHAGDPNRFIVAEDGTLVADVYPDTHEDLSLPDDYEANAHLLATSLKMLAAVKAMREKYGRVHDALSDMIEGGRLRKEHIPDDYQALVQYLEDATGADNQARDTVAKAQPKA